MVFANKYTQDLMDKFPIFSKSSELEKTIELYSDNEKINIHIILTALSHYIVKNKIKNSDVITGEEKDIYKYLENIRCKFFSFPEDSDEGKMDNAICTCFLENILNKASDNQIKYSRFIPYIGEKSKEYCRAWDQFTGVRSEGLWSDEQWANAKKGADSLS